MSSGSAETNFICDTKPDVVRLGNLTIGSPDNVIQLQPFADQVIREEEFPEEKSQIDFDQIEDGDGDSREQDLGMVTKEANKRLSLNEERRLLLRAKMGDVDSRDKLVEANFWVVKYLARRLQGSGVDFDDLVQAGSDFLFTDAIKYKNVESNMRLSTYAYVGIRWKMLKAIEKSKSTNGNERIMSFSQPIREDPDPAELGDLLPDQDRLLDPVYALIEKNRQAEFESLLTTLSDEERRALELRFGLEDGKEHRLHAIGREIYPNGSPESRAEGSPKSHTAYEMYGFHLVQNALKKLRKDPRTPFIHEYLAYVDEKAQ